MRQRQTLKILYNIDPIYRQPEGGTLAYESLHFMFLLLYIMYKLKLLRNNALLLSEPDTTSSSSVPTQQEYLEIEAIAAHPDDHSQRHLCIPTHPKDMEGLEIEATAAHPDDHL